MQIGTSPEGRTLAWQLDHSARAANVVKGKMRAARARNSTLRIQKYAVCGLPHSSRIFGKDVKLDTPLQTGDRVEVYRAIICDPTQILRRDGEDDEV